VLAPIVAALAVGGCGGDSGDAEGDGGGGVDSSEGVSTSSLSKPEFVKRANSVCAMETVGLAEEAATFVEMQRRRRHKPLPVLTADLAHFVLLPAIERQLWRLYQLIGKLGAPRGDEERIDEALDLERLAVDAVATTHRIPSLKAVYRPFRASARIFRAYGLGACANGPAPPVGVSISRP